MKPRVGKSIPFPLSHHNLDVANSLVDKKGKKSDCNILDATANVIELEDQQPGMANQLLVHLLVSGLQSGHDHKRGKDKVVRMTRKRKTNLGFQDQEETLKELVGNHFHGN